MPNGDAPVLGYGQPTESGGLLPYKSCLVEAKKNNYEIGTPPPQTIGARAVNGVGGPGLNNLDIVRLQCYYLTTKQRGIAGNTTVLNIDNFADCRIDVVPDVNAVLAEATKLYGGGKDLGFFGNIAAELEDANASDEGSKGLMRIISKIADMPRLNTPERNALEGARSLAVQTIEVIMKALSESPLGKQYEDTLNELKRLLLSSIDAVFQIGDYVTEFMAARNEAAARFYSGQRRDSIAASYEAIYGVKPSMATIGTWCRYGNTQAFETDSTSAYLAAPGDAQGTAREEAQKQKAMRRVAETSLGTIKTTFGEKWQRFFGLSAVLAMWQMIYEPDEFDDAGLTFAFDEKEGVNDLSSGPSLHEHIRKAAKDASSDEYKEIMWKNVGDGNKNERNTFIIKGNNQIEKVLDSRTGAEPEKYSTFWSDRGDYDANSAVPIQRRTQAMKDCFQWLWNTYPPTVVWDKGYTGAYQKVTVSPRVGGKFAGEMWEVWNFWAEYIKRAYPYNGKKVRYNKFRDFLIDNIDRFFAAANGKPERLATVPWEQRFVWATTGVIEPLQVGAKAPSGNLDPCPVDMNDRSTGTACLPCDAIRNRLPIGAKSFPIPMLIKFTGRNPRQSPEFKKWAQNLRTNGYPDFYIDCIARDATWSGPGGTTFRYAKSGPLQPINVSSGVAAAYAQQQQKQSAKSDFAGVVGLTAPRFATLGVLPPPPLPQLAGITRPMMIEALPSQKKVR